MKSALPAFILGLTATASLCAGTVSVTFVGANGETDSSGNLISPYEGAINGANTNLYCDDFANTVTYGETWTANVTNLASGDLSNTRYGTLDQTLATSNGTAMFNGFQLYEMAAYLVTQFSNNPASATNNGYIQDTIWDLFNPNSVNTGVNPPVPPNNTYLFAAEANYSSINASQFSIVTQTAPVPMSGGIQEFIVATPEPSSMLMLGLGLMFVSGFLYRRHKARVSI